MPMVVSDTSSISNLAQIGLVELLYTLDGEITMTPSVQRELYRLKTHQRAINDLDWIRALTPKDQGLVDELLLELDAGESESIALALENQAEYLIVGELKGRLIADRLGIQIVGVLGVLVQAKKYGIIFDLFDLKAEIEKLRSVGFKLDQNLVNTVLARLEN